MKGPLSKSIVLWSVVGAVLVMLSAPTIVVIGASFTSGNIIDFPPDGFSLKWYEKLPPQPIFGTHSCDLFMLQQSARLFPFL
jgi:ABC-type spermidine/putrescine transport system permease subunit II